MYYSLTTYRLQTWYSDSNQYVDDPYGAADQLVKVIINVVAVWGISISQTFIVRS